ncbi:hypothetical protein C5H24_12510 [Xylella fastidiosa]|jgi:hypothetical protein|uniref:hypothetical protein n=1 Tax=Xylella fastidiosa TaxID=2371 RepID=UPI001CA41A2A
MLVREGTSLRAGADDFYDLWLAVKGLKREIFLKGNGKRKDIRTYPHLLLLIHLPSVTKSAQRKLRKEAT